MIHVNHVQSVSTLLQLASTVSYLYCIGCIGQFVACFRLMLGAWIQNNAICKGRHVARGVNAAACHVPFCMSKGQY